MASNNFNESRQPGIDTVNRDASGQLLTWRENGFRCEAIRNAAGYVTAVRANGNGSYAMTITRSATGACLGVGGDVLNTQFMNELTAAGLPLTARISAQGVISGVIEDPPTPELAAAIAKLPGKLTIFRDPTGAVRYDYDYDAWRDSTFGDVPLSRTIHVATTGTGGGSGIGIYLGDFSTAKNSLSSAITAANATGLPCKIIVDEGEYLRPFGWQGVVNTVPVQIFGWHYGDMARRPVFLTADNLTYTPEQVDTGGGNMVTVYKSSAVNNPIRTINRLSKNQDGGTRTFTKCASVLLAASTAGDAWYYDSVTKVVYLKRQDGAVPTILNTAVCMFVKCYASGTGGADVIVDGVVFLGGYGMFEKAPTRHVLLKDCDMLDQGGPDYVANALTVLDVASCVAIKCKGVGASSDGYNSHAASGVRPVMVILDCVGLTNGKDGGASCNGVTTHDGCVAIVFGGAYQRNRGPQIIPVNPDSKMWVVGATVSDGGPNGSGGPSQNFQAGDGGTLYIADCKSYRSDGDMAVSNGGRIFFRRHDGAWCRTEKSVDAAPSSISPY